MINLLFITFDYHELNKPIKSVAIATLEAYLKMNIKNIDIEQFSFNMNDEYSIIFEQMSKLLKKLETKYDYICISMYAWNMRYVDQVINLIESTNTNATIVAGGYEVSSRTIKALKNEYKSIDNFIIGYAEESLYKLITKEDTTKVLSYEVDNNKIIEIYSNSIIEVNSKSIVRLETKRGCTGNCTFCAYKNNDHKKLTVHNFEKVKREFRFLNQANISKVNILDAIFTINNYKKIIDYLIQIDFKPIISLQMKFELFYKEMQRDEKLLESLSKLNVELEFGLQSISQKALDIVERTNNFKIIQSVVATLNKHKIKYELSIIRGLPGETPESYSNLFRFLKKVKCTKIVVYPLTLLTNTKLYDDKTTLELFVHKQNGLNYVIETQSYSYNDYLKMISMESI